MLPSMPPSISPQRTSAINLHLCQSILAALFLTSSVSGQTTPAISGTVKTREGQPLAGVLVYGSMSKTCCPFKREQTATNSEGQFLLEQPGRVIHLSLIGLQPKTIVLGEERSEFQVLMESATNNLIVPSCGPPASGSKRIGWGNNGLQFDVANHEAKILGGKPDVDYVRYAIKPRAGKSYLELWFGVYATDLDANDDQFIDSVEFAERNVVFPDGSLVGKDSSGLLHSGRRWRHTSVLGQGAASYRAATEEDAKMFDQIISSICYVPYPRR